MIATALLEAAGGTIAGLHAEVDEMRRTCGIRHTPEGLPFGYEALLGAADYLQQTRPGLGVFPLLPVILTAASAAAAYGVTKTKAYAESLLSGIGFSEVDTEETIVLLHGTSSWRLESIARTGLSSHRVCLTDNEAVAEEFGKVTLLEDHDNYEIMKRHPDSRPLPQEPFLAILRVTVTNLNQLRADPVMNRNPVTQVLVEKYGIDNENDFRQAVKRGEIELPKNEKDWRGSLRAVSSVEYKGVIPPENLDIWYEDRWIPLLMKSWNPPAFAESLMSGTERTLDQQVEKFNVRFKSVLRNSHLAQQILDTMMLTDWGAGGCWMLAEALVGWINEKEDEAELWVVNSKECLTEHLVAKNKRLGLFFDYDGAQTKEQVLTSMRKEAQHEGLDLVPFDLKQYEDPLVYGISYDEEAVSILLGVFQKHLGSFEDWFPRRAV